MAKIFVDSDVILDLISHRDPFYNSAAHLFTMVDSGKVTAYCSPLIFSNLYYILKRQKDKEFALSSLRKLKLLLQIVTINERIIELSLTSNFNDFEDEIQYYSARESGINYLITRNKSDYKVSDIIICSADEFLDLQEKQNN